MRCNVGQALRVLGLVPLLLLAANADGDALKPLEGGKEYASAEGHYTIAFPESWTTTPKDKGAVLSVSQREEGQTFSPNVNVLIDDVPAGASAAEYLAAVVAQVKTVATDFEQLEEHKGSVNGHEVAWVIWKGKMKSGDTLLEVQDLILAMTSDKKAFLVTCTALPPQFDGIRQTFEGVSASLKVE